MPPDFITFSKTASALIKNFENLQKKENEKKIIVNILLSKVASYYEKIRTAMDYGTEETILRRAIERILKRRLFLEQPPKNLAENLVRELIWAGYFKDSVPESITEKVAESIELFTLLKNKVIEKKIKLPVDTFGLFIELLSSDINSILLPNKEKESVSNFMFHVLKNSIEIVDDSKQTRDAQVFLAIRKNFDRDDLAFLRYKMFSQIFGKLTRQSFNNIVENFEIGVSEIEYQLTYPRKDRIFNHVKRNTPPFLILYDLLMLEKSNLTKLAKNDEELRKRIFEICRARYKSIKGKVTTAILRSFVFILITKAIIALIIEGTFERIFYGGVQWLTITINTTTPPLLMLLVGLFIQTPGDKNTIKIYSDIIKLLYEDDPQIYEKLYLKPRSKNGLSFNDYLFSLLWALSILLVFGILVFILSKLGFNPLSQGIFIFFVAIVSFLAYRIFQTANLYTVVSKQNILLPIVDFFFVPVVRVGRRLTEGVAQINFILIIVDFIIEAPFKGLVGFFEQWFSFLARKREELE